MSVVTKEIVVDQRAAVVWSLITNPKKFHALRIPHAYEPYATGEPRAGAIFEGMSIHGGPSWYMQVVDCRTHTEFSFGRKDRPWQYRYVLLEQGARTFVTFSRRYRFSIFSLFEGAIKQKLVDDTLQSLNRACDNLAAGRPDGLTESP